MPEHEESGEPAVFTRDDVTGVDFRDEEARWHGGGEEWERSFVYPGRRMVVGDYPLPARRAVHG